jgi:hypothetical protein
MFSQHLDSDSYRFLWSELESVEILGKKSKMAEIFEKAAKTGFWSQIFKY